MLALANHVWRRWASRASRTLPASSASTTSEERPQQLPFAKARLGPFVQEAPRLHNQYTTDGPLKSYLRRLLPQQVLQDIEPDLKRFGQRVTQDIHKNSINCERNPPQLIHFDAWGNRVDEIVTSEGWRKMKDISAEEGMISIAYERKYHQWSRIYQAVKLYLFSASSGLYNCPLAMTDGAAKTIEALDLKQLDPVFQRLISRNPKEFWTSGQWMTERQGGSDVANGTETVAIPDNDSGTYRLFGYKWFSSATDSDMALTLARIQQQDGSIIEGTNGLSMFFVEMKRDDGSLNNIEVVKLKNKLGTRQLPTAELLLDGTKAIRVSDEGRGVAAIANMLNVTRIHNTLSSAAAMRRGVSLARDYAQRRFAFGNAIGDYPLHVQTLCRLDVEARGCTLLSLEAARWMGLVDCGLASADDAHMLRLLTPICKLYTAKQAMGVTSETLEAFGGQGYIEDTGLPNLLRDCQVTPIWEGTTNILCLDVLRVIARTKGDALRVFREDVSRRLASASDVPQLAGPRARASSALDRIGDFVKNNPSELQVSARDLAFSLARTFIAALLIEHAGWRNATKQDMITAHRWCMRDLEPVIRGHKLGLYSLDSIGSDRALLMDGYNSSELQ